MGLVDDKKNIFTTIGAYTSLKEEKNLPDTTNLFSSINNKKDIGSFLVDVLGVVVGSTALQDLIGELFANFAGTAEPTLKKAMKKQLLDFNSGDDLPDSFKSDGIDIPVKEIDVNGKYKTDPDTVQGSLLYGSSSSSFDRTAYSAIANPGTTKIYKNLRIKYNESDDTFTFKSNGGGNIGDWFNNYVDQTEFLNKKSFTSNVMNNLFGSVTASENKSNEEVLNDLQINKIIQQLIENEDDNPENNDAFQLSDKDNENLLDLANQLKNGVIEYDMGCGIITTELPINDMADLVNFVSSSTDPFAVGNAVNSSLSNSFQSGAVNDATDNESTSQENEETIKNGFFTRLIQFLQLELAKLLCVSPQARLLLALSSTFKSGNTNLSSPQEDLQNFKVFIKCLIKEALAILYEFIFNLIVAVLVALVLPIIKMIIKEKINQYIGVIKSLISSNI